LQQSGLIGPSVTYLASQKTSRLPCALPASP
jgi:hypothetical protein